MNNETIKLTDAINAIKALHNILGDAGTKAAVMALEGIPAVSTGWISANDMLPEVKDNPVLGYIAEYSLTQMVWYHCSTNRWETPSGFELQVTHWMPLPDAPKED